MQHSSLSESHEDCYPRAMLDAHIEHRPFSFSRAERGCWLEVAHPCVSKEAKPTKIVSLIEEDFCAHSLKMFQFLRALSAIR